MVKMDQPEDNIPDAHPPSKRERVLATISQGLARARGFRFGRARRILEAYKRGRGGTLKLPAWKAAVGEEPLVPFSEQMALYAADPIAGSSVDFITGQVIGGGFHPTMSEEYEEVAKIEGETAPAEKTALEIVEDYDELVKMRSLLKNTVKEVVAYGNSFWHVPEEDLTQVKQVPLDAVVKIFRGEARDWKPTTKVPADKIGYQLSYEWESARVLEPDEVIHFRFNPIGDMAFGFGMLTRVCMKLPLGHGETRDEFYKIYGRAQLSEILWLEQFAKGNELWIFEEAQDLDNIRKMVKNMPRSGGRYVTDIKGAKVQQVVPERARGADAYINDLQNAYILAMQTPLPKLFTTPGFTEASANAAIEMAERKVMDIQQFFKEIIEKDVWWPLIDDAGLNPAEAQVTLNWGMPEPLDFEALKEIFPILVQLWQGGAIFTFELREVLRTICRLPIEQMKKPEFITQMGKDKKIREAIMRLSGTRERKIIVERKG